MLTLYTTPLSAKGRKVLAVSEHLGLAPRIVHVDVYRGEGRTPAYLAEGVLGRRGPARPTLVCTTATGEAERCALRAALASLEAR